MSTTKEQNAGSSKIYELHQPSFWASFWVVFDMKVEMFLVKVWFDILDFNKVLLKYLNICNYSVIILYFLTRDRFWWAGFVRQRHGSAVLEPKLWSIASVDRNSKITAHYLSPLEQEKPLLQGASCLLKVLCSCVWSSGFHGLSHSFTLHRDGHNCLNLLLDRHLTSHKEGRKTQIIKL